MTTAKRVGLTSIALISLGASAGYYAVMAAFFSQTKAVSGAVPGFNYLALALVATLATLIVVVFWRSINRTVSLIASQLDNMTKTGQIGLVMVETPAELSIITRRINEFLSSVRGQTEQLRSENRELQIQSRIAAAEKHHTEAIIFSISDAVIVTNRFDELVLANQAAEQLLGFKLSAAQRKSIDRIISDSTLVRLIRETRNHGGQQATGYRLQATGTPETAGYRDGSTASHSPPSGRNNSNGVAAQASSVSPEVCGLRSEASLRTRKVVEHSFDEKGTPRTFSITLSCVMAGEEFSVPVDGTMPIGNCGPAFGSEAQARREVAGVVAVLHDITREKEISRMKTDFVSNVSHELKTPLASIKAYIEMLIDGEAEDAKTQREFYDIISSETERLHRLIENILNISRIESGVVKVVKEPIELTSVVKQVLDVAAPQAKMKSLTLVERLLPVYKQVEADHDMIYQAVMNLVSNAIKYTPNGGTITVDLSVDERRGAAVCTIADTGAGIPADDLPHIFDKFYRVQANQKMAKGTGLGLTLVKHIIETVHDGKLSVTSETGKGSTFSFELPTLE